MMTTMGISNIRVTKKISDFTETKMLSINSSLPTIQTFGEKRLWNENKYSDLIQYFTLHNATNQMEE